jgi:hypothetical protein
MIGIITAGHLHMRCVESLLAAQQAGVVEEIVIQQCGPYLDVGRNQMVDTFMTKDYDHLLFVDSDIGFVPEDVTTLVEDDLPIVSGIYHSMFATGIHPIAYEWAEHEGRQRMTPIKEWNRPEGEALVPVDGVGAGFLMIHRTVLEKFAAIYSFPQIWFSNEQRGGVLMGEDLSFCVRATDLDIPTIVDRRVQLAHEKSIVLRGPYTNTL